MPAGRAVDTARPGRAAPDRRRGPRRHRDAGLGRAPGHPRRRWRPARAHLDRLFAIRRAAPGPGHRRRGGGRTSSRTITRSISAWPATAAPRRSASGSTAPTRSSSSARDSTRPLVRLRDAARRARPGRTSTSTRARAGRASAPPTLTVAPTPGVPPGGERAAARSAPSSTRARRDAPGQQHRRPRRFRGRDGRRRRRPWDGPGRPSRADRHDPAPGPARRRDPDHRRGQFRGLGRPRLPLPPAGDVPRPDVRGDGLRPAGRDRGGARPSRPAGRRARRRRRARR